MGLPKIVDKNLPGSLKSTPFLDAWIRIARDGAVTVFTGKVELGTGLRTALMQIAVEQLELAPSSINFVTADTAARRTKATRPIVTAWLPSGSVSLANAGGPVG